MSDSNSSLAPNGSNSGSSSFDEDGDLTDQKPCPDIWIASDVKRGLHGIQSGGGLGSEKQS